MPEKNPEPQTPAQPTGPSFEESLEELETIVSRLEDGDRPLEESLALYENGVAALKRCHTILNSAEQRIRMVVNKGRGIPQLVDMETGEVPPEDEEFADEGEDEDPGEGT